MLSTASASPVPPAIIEDEVSTVSPDTVQILPNPLAPPSPTDLGSLSSQLHWIAKAIENLSSSLPPPMAHPESGAMEPVPRLILTMTAEDIARLLHHQGASFPSVCPCNTANALDTKMHWSAKELHQIIGGQKFRSYKHLLQASRDGKWVNGGEFPPSLAFYATIPKSKQGGALNCIKYKFLDAVHMDITFGDCVSIGGFRYALILVDCANRYNWTFGLKNVFLRASSQQSVSSMPWQVHWQGVSILTVT